MATAAAEAAGAGLGPDAVLVLAFLGPRAIRRANRQFLGRDRATDVIAFDYRRGRPRPGPGEVAVELLICPDAALARSRELRNVTYAGEMALYLVHGLLHAAGLDDLTPAGRRQMRAAERRVLRTLRPHFSPERIFPKPRCSPRH